MLKLLLSSYPLVVSTTELIGHKVPFAIMLEKLCNIIDQQCERERKVKVQSRMREGEERAVSLSACLSVCAGFRIASPSSSISSFLFFCFCFFSSKVGIGMDFKRNK